MRAAYDAAKDSLSHSASADSGRDGEGDKDRQDDAKLGALQHQDIVMHHKVIEVCEARRRSAVRRSAAERRCVLA
jgi:hypothetical protein